MAWNRGLPPPERLVLIAVHCWRAIDCEGNGASAYAVDQTHIADALLKTGRLKAPVQWVQHLELIACIRIGDDLIGTNGALLERQEQVKQACAGWMDLPSPEHLKAKSPAGPCLLSSIIPAGRAGA